ncbi:hypothetical protein KNE206_21760 [Kitasatospora sp. NE20-6]
MATLLTSPDSETESDTPSGRIPYAPNPLPGGGAQGCPCFRTTQWPGNTRTTAPLLGVTSRWGL